MSMESFITVHYESTGFTFQNRGSDSFLGFEEGHSFKESFIASKISNGWMKRNAKMQITSKFLKH